VPNELNYFDKVWNSAGLSYTQDQLFENVDWYAESNILITHFRAPGQLTELPKGYGTFSALSWTPESWKVKLEAKDYRDYHFEFRRPPTLEDDVVVSDNTEDISGSRLEVEKKWANSNSSNKASYLLEYDRTQNRPIHHGIVGAKFSPNLWETEMKLGYRTMPERSVLYHGSAKGKMKTFKGQAIELNLRKQYETTKLDLIPQVEDRNATDLTYTFSERWVASLGYEYMPSNDPETGQHFLNAAITYRATGFQGRVFLGKTSGGTLCSGGVCRKVPAFDGALLETSITL
jgi:hypothetical protein